MRKYYLRRPSRILIHSAKGSTWEEHKYIKRINGLYYYPDSYEGGRHLSDEQKAQFGKDKVEIDNLSDNDVEKLALEGIRGNFGNGQIRKDNLGAHYQQVQDRINEIMRSSGPDNISSKKVSEVSDSTKSSGSTATSTAVKKSKGINLEQVYSVYKKQEERNGTKSSTSSSSSFNKGKSDRAGSNTKSVSRRR